MHVKHSTREFLALSHRLWPRREKDADGCVGGGGQSWGSNMAKRARRGESLYAEDKSLPHRRSHENLSVKAVYEKFLEKPNSEKSHKLLHTHYYKRSTVDGKVLPGK